MEEWGLLCGLSVLCVRQIKHSRLDLSMPCNHKTAPGQIQPSRGSLAVEIPVLTCLCLVITRPPLAKYNQVGEVWPWRSGENVERENGEWMICEGSGKRGMRRFNSATGDAYHVPVLGEQELRGMLCKRRENAGARK